MGPLRKFKIKIKEKVAESEVTRRILNGTIWGSLGGLVTRIFTILFSFLLARTLGSQILGEYGIINTTSSTISGLAGLGLGATISRYAAALKNSDPERLGRLIGLTFFIGWISACIYGALYIYFAPWLASEVYNAPHLTLLLKISSISFMFGLVNSIQTASLTGLEAFKISSILSTLTIIFQTFTVLVFSYFYGLNGAIMSGSFTAIGSFIVFFIFSRREYKARGIHISFGKWKSELKVIWEYSLPAFFSSMITGPVVWWTNAMLVNEANGFAELGVLNVALQWDNAVRFLPMYIGMASIPVMTDVTMNTGSRQGFLLTVKLMRTVFFVSLPVALFIAAISPLIIKGYGSTFDGGEWTLVITVITTVFILVSNQVGSFISATGKMWLGFLLNLVWGLIFVGSAYLFVNQGAIGLASAKLVAYVLHFLLSLLLCFYFVKQHKAIN